MNYTIGIDYGTGCCRAAAVSVLNGMIAGKAQMEYPHGVFSRAMPDGTPLAEGSALALPEDYLEVLPVVVRGCIRDAGIDPREVIGIGVDATTCTLLPVDRAGDPLTRQARYQSSPHACIKLWKHHTPTRQTEVLQSLAEREKMKFLRRCGFHVSCEWAIPKIMETREEAWELYCDTAYFVEAGDWINWRLSGERNRSAALAGLKSFWIKGAGYPEQTFWDRLYPGFGGELERKLWGSEAQLKGVGECAGRLLPEMAELLGLPAGIPLSAAAADGHSSMAALALSKPGDASLVVGTSNVLAFLSSELCELDGVCAVVEDGLLPGFYGYDTGQPATGDMLDWLARSLVPSVYERQAAEKGLTVHELLSTLAEASRPWENTLTVLDWWNGSRGTRRNKDLRGMLYGLSLGTKPEDIYCAMLHGIACGTRKIREHCKEAGILISSLTASGGIPLKNPFFMQEYANILNLPIRVAAQAELPAKGAAVLAAVAAGAYPAMGEAMEAMKTREYRVFQPQPQFREAYEAIYRRYSKFDRLLSE